MEKDQKVGMWTLVKPLEEGKRWLCVCECGTTKSVSTKHLKARATKSCGCFSRRLHMQAMGHVLKGGAHVQK